MKDIEEIRQFVNYRLKKDVFGNAFTPTQFNIALAVANMEYFCLRYGLPAEYQKGSPIARQNFESTLKITDDMRIFISNGIDNNGTPLQLDDNGVAELPTDYVHKTRLQYQYILNASVEYKDVEVLTNAQWGYRIGSSIKKPSKKLPVANIIGSKIRFFPKNLKVVEIEYLRKPKAPFYATTEDPETQREVYDPLNSVQLEWPIDCLPDIANMVLSYAADNLQAPAAKQSAEMRKQQGV